MIRITRMTDYGIMLLTYFAREDVRPMRNARELAEQSHLALPTVSKILKVLAHKGLLVGQRGVKGGFSLARTPQEITVAQIVDAVEGQMHITKCSDEAPGKCRLEDSCPVQSNWQRISHAVWQALGNITLADMARPLNFSLAPMPHTFQPIAKIGASGYGAGASRDETLKHRSAGDNP